MTAIFKGFRAIRDHSLLLPPALEKLSKLYQRHDMPQPKPEEGTPPASSDDDDNGHDGDYPRQSRHAQGQLLHRRTSLSIDKSADI